MSETLMNIVSNVWATVGYLVCMLVGFSLLGTGLYLIYAYNFTKEVDGQDRNDPHGAKMNVLGGFLVVLSSFFLWPCFFTTESHAMLRRAFNAREGQYTVGDKLRGVKIVDGRDENNNQTEEVAWKRPTNGIPLWFAINVITANNPKPNTSVLPGNTLSYGPLPEDWEGLEIWYGTSLGPSMEEKISNPRKGIATSMQKAIPAIQQTSAAATAIQTPAPTAPTTNSPLLLTP